MSKGKLLIGAAVLALVAGGVFVASQHFPAKTGTTAGTVAPMERYHNSQVGEHDVTTGDTTIPNIMQTDSFQDLSKNTQAASAAASQASAAAASSAASMAASNAAAQAAAAAASQAAHQAASAAASQAAFNAASNAASQAAHAAASQAANATSAASQAAFNA